MMLLRHQLLLRILPLLAASPRASARSARGIAKPRPAGLFKDAERAQETAVWYHKGEYPFAINGVGPNLQVIGLSDP